MAEVSKADFDAYVTANCAASSRREPRVERDGAFKYECYDDEAGKELAFISYNLSEIDGAPDVHYFIKDQD